MAVSPSKSSLGRIIFASNRKKAVVPHISQRGFHIELDAKVSIFNCCEPKISNIYAANPRSARGESRISFDMLKSLRRV